MPEPLDLDLRRLGRHRALMAVITAYLRADRPEDPRLVAHLDERAGVDVAAGDPGRDLFLTWDHARRLVAAGMGVGAHTHNHPRLARLPEAEQRAELAGSREVLERELGRAVTALAYPFGDAAAFDATTARLAREAGYRVAFSLGPRSNRPGATDPFDVGRINVAAAESPALFRARLALTTAFGASPL